MKSGAVLAAILSGHAAVASLSPRLDRRQIDPEAGMIIAKLVGPKGSGMIPGLVKSLVNKGYGKVRDVPGAAPNRQVLESRAPHLKATTVKVSQRSTALFRIPNIDKNRFDMALTRFQVVRLDC